MRPGDDLEGDGGADLDRAGAVGDGRAVERIGRAVSAVTTPSPRGSSNSVTVASHQWTILASGSSMMSLAPASFRAGMRVLMSVLATTVSTA